MTEESRGLARAVAALRAELHSRGLGGSRIVIEVDAEKWHAIVLLDTRNHSADCAGGERCDCGAWHRAKNAGEVVLISDVVNGDVVVRPKAAESIAATFAQLTDLGLQKPTLEKRVEVLETQLRSVLTRLGFAGAV